MAMRMMGEQFVTGQTIDEALANSRQMEARGLPLFLRHAGRGGADRSRRGALSHATTKQAIHAIGKASKRRGIYEGPGISIKLSALHPRYSRAQQRARDARAAAARCCSWRCWRAATTSA